MANRVTQILGAGNASQSFQRFELKQLPLTYRAAANEIGAAAELTVRVDDVAWTELPTLYRRRPGRPRLIRSKPTSKAAMFVAFGDGAARRAPAERRQQRARRLSQGIWASTAMSTPTV